MNVARAFTTIAAASVIVTTACAAAFAQSLPPVPQSATIRSGDATPPQPPPPPPPGDAGAGAGCTLSSSIASPALPATGWARGVFQIAPCAAAPKIDGKLDDPCWKNATHVSGFFRLATSGPVPEQTEVWLCADKTHLYLAFHCLDHHPELIKASETQRNGSVFRDDFVAIDIDSQSTRRNASTFVVTERGTQWELLEGGTADNITWAGDWLGASTRTSDGCTSEMSIPFALLRYARGAHEVGMLIYRHISRETTLTGWPYIPPQALTGDNSVEAPYLSKFDGIAPPFFAPKPVFLPYALGSVGETNSGRVGFDVKYPLSTTLTGVATLEPDFQDIEQSVTSINFSYTPKLLTDQRPFFAEGSGFLPENTIFYSRSIGDIDGGIKVAGKTGPATIGILATTFRGSTPQDTRVFNLAEDIGTLSSATVSYADDQQAGLDSNQVWRGTGTYGFNQGSTTLRINPYHYQSWVGPTKQGGDDGLTLSSTPTQGRVGVNVNYNDIAPNFVSDLGFVPDVDLKGWSSVVNMYNQFDKGSIESYYWESDESSYQHHSVGGFFKNQNSIFGQLSWRSGWGLSQYDQISQRDQFHDNVENVILNWNGKTLYQRGSIEQDIGRLEDQNYNFISFNQGFLISKPFSVQLSYNRQNLGGAITTQTIATGTYRLDNYRAFGGRIVSQDSQTDIYFSYSQQVRRGNDLFIIFGDPNSPTTKGMITVKIVSPMSL